jgi:ABC-type branched-subunit amino acid transport system ATPase component
VSFSIDRGELFSIIGPNGAGKTSMVNCISGRYSPTEGQIFFKGQDVTGMTPNNRAEIGIGRTFQNLALFGHMTVLDNIMVGRHHLLKNNFLTGALYWFTGARDEELAHRREIEEIIDFPRHPACPQIDRRNPVLRPPQTGRTGARHGAEAGPDPAGRTDGRHETSKRRRTWPATSSI